MRGYLVFPLFRPRVPLYSSGKQLILMGLLVSFNGTLAHW